MARRPTIADVAERAGVSKGAVSFALNGRPGVGDATRTRILEAAQELGWSPNARARALSSARSLALGLVISREVELLTDDPFFLRFVAGVEIVLAPRGYALMLQVVGADPGVEAAAYRRLTQEGRVDGVFLTDLRPKDPRVDLVAELGLPALGIGTPESGSALPAIGIDDEEGVRAAVEHLVALGHVRIAHVTGSPGYVHTISRQRAWASVLERHGLSADLVEVGDFSALSGAEATRRLLARTDAPTAIVFAGDVMALAGEAAARAAGVDVPRELSVVGFDDIPAAAHALPPLTTVRQDAVAWGRGAAAALLELVEGRAPPAVVLEPATLVLRASTAPPGTRLRAPPGASDGRTPRPARPITTGGTEQ